MTACIFLVCFFGAYLFFLCVYGGRGASDCIYYITIQLICEDLIVHDNIYDV